MATLNVPGTYPTIAAALAVAVPTDTIVVAAGYAGNEVVTVGVNNVGFDVPASVTGRTPVIDMQDQEEPVAPQFVAPAPQPSRSTPVADTGSSLMSEVTADVSAHAMARLLAGNVAVEREARP